MDLVQDGVQEGIRKLVAYAVRCGLIEKEDIVWAINSLLILLKKHEPNVTKGEVCLEAEGIPEEALEDGSYLEGALSGLLDYAAEAGIIEGNSVAYRDLFDTKLMGCLTMRPSELIRRFREMEKEDPKKATDFFYKFSRDNDYIRRYRIKKDQKWKAQTEYGELDVTINLSKPEKDPKAIAAAGRGVALGYPKCQLCRECEGYEGRLDYPARENHRIIPISIQGATWGFQYSPYVYYNEHCIVLNMKHVPMVIDKAVYLKLFDFVRQFPHYFVGSNADLPIVGGSILAHEHFQGGRYEFAMAKAPVERRFSVYDYPDVEAGVVKWPMSVIRLSGTDPNRMAGLADRVLRKWRGYTDESQFIFSETDGEPHSTITPIARMRGEKYELDLVLRNNITTKEHPLGVFHPHAELHHIKKENIGLIEVMGLAVLPSRLQGEMALLREAILNGSDIRANEAIRKHADWAEQFLPKYDKLSEENVDEILRHEIGDVFLQVLMDAGVFKRTPEGQSAFDRFIDIIL